MGMAQSPQKAHVMNGLDFKKGPKGPFSKLHELLMRFLIGPIGREP